MGNKMKYILLISFLFFSFANTQEQDIINEKFIDTNFALFSQKDKLLTSILKLINIGNYDLLKYYLKKLSAAKINFQNELEEAINRKMSKIQAVYNKLKYKDESDVQVAAPAFEWAENKHSVIMHIKYSSMLNSMGCPEVDGEKMTIGKNKRTITYHAKCIQSDYQIKFELKLTLFDKVSKIDRHTTERGESRFSISKEKPEEWGRLLKPGERLPENSIKMY